MYQKKIIFLISLFLFPFFLNEISLASQNISYIPLEKITGNQKNYKEGEVIVKYKDKEQLNRKIEKINKGESTKNLAKVKKEIEDTKVTLIKSENKKTDELINELKDDENVEYVEPNYIRYLAYIPNDTYFSIYQWAHRNTGQDILGDIGTVDADANITEAWDIESGEANSTTLAVIDSGVRHTHSDISSNMWDGTVCFDENDSLIGSGCPNHGWDYENDDDNPDDSDGHGTYVSTIAGSITNNSSGIAGISRYNNVNIMALRFDVSSIFTEIESINFAKNNGAKVINASFSGSGYSTPEKNAIDGFDGIFVAAAGNGGVDQIGDNNETSPQYPCSYNSTNIICVAATNQDDAITTFSNYGTTSVDLAAPGKNIIGYSYESALNGWDYYIGDGTSFSSPLVAGTATLLYAHNGSLTPAQVKSLILSNVDVIPSLATKVVTSGRLNTNSALSALNSSPGFLLPPQRTNGQPSGTLAVGTNSTTISLTTNETATCKYGTTGDVTYANIPNIFSTTGGTSHSQNISGLSNGNTYSYYIRCSDGIDKNLDDFIISFSVASEALNLTPIYRVYNTTTGSHVYTRGAAERDLTLNTWSDFIFVDGGPAFYASLKSQPGLTPIYRVYNTATGGHVYTRGAAERDLTLNTWSDFIFVDGGPAFYADIFK